MPQMSSDISVVSRVKSIALKVATLNVRDRLASSVRVR